ncbi:unnamed protein product [Nippostrongylus brasiliensis]|uniref:G protein-coupled receptor n=1 Tax=Nippostrongylus brasiliensis TaxID=27835 RepID=A0A0N4Y623_NIPBR|nr:unnamed protein product [Nippostrongylus brasiliensis]
MEFDDNSKHYKLLTLVHVKHAAVLSGLIVLELHIFPGHNMTPHLTPLFRFVMPFLIYHAFLISLNAITALIAVGELVADQNPQVDASDITARAVLLVMPIVCCFEALMVVIVMKVRTYLKDKRRHIRNGLPPVSPHILFKFGPFILDSEAVVQLGRQSAETALYSSLDFLDSSWNRHQSLGKPTHA